MARTKQHQTKRLGAKMPSSALLTVAGEARHVTALNALCKHFEVHIDDAKISTPKLSQLDETCVYFFRAGDANKCMNLIYDTAGKGYVSTYGSAAFEYKSSPQVCVIPDGFKVAFFYEKRLFLLEVGVTREDCVSLCFRCMDLTEGANPACSDNFGPWCEVLADAMMEASRMVTPRGDKALRRGLECAFILHLFWSRNIRELVAEDLREVTMDELDDKGEERTVQPPKDLPEMDEEDGGDTGKEQPWMHDSDFTCNAYGNAREPVFAFMLDDDPREKLRAYVEALAAAEAGEAPEVEEGGPPSRKKAKVDAAEDDIEYGAQSPAY